MKPYTVTRINDHTWQIAEVYHLPAALPMYLTVGSERAALVDTGMGLGCLRKTVEEITPLPVAVCNTHAHIDHAAGNNEFDTVYMHPAEEAGARAGFPVERRMEFIELKCMYDPAAEELLRYAREHITEYEPEYQINFIEDGDRIDLGGVTLEVIHVPGHTKGSIVYVNRADKSAFCGDAVNPRSSIGMFPGSPTVKDYQEALTRFLSLTEDIEHFYVGHRLYAFTREDVKDVLQCAMEIVEGAQGEPYPMIVSRGEPVWGRIHWHNGKRITYQLENVK